MGNAGIAGLRMCRGIPENPAFIEMKLNGHTSNCSHANCQRERKFALIKSERQPLCEQAGKIRLQ